MNRILKFLITVLALHSLIFASVHNQKVTILASNQRQLIDIKDTLEKSMSKISGIKVVKYSKKKMPHCSKKNLQCYRSFGENRGLDYIIVISTSGNKINVKCLDVALADTVFTENYDNKSGKSEKITDKIVLRFKKIAKNFKVETSPTLPIESVPYQNESGTISIRTTPKNAHVNVNGIEIGQTPLLNRKFFEGRYIFRIYMNNYLPISEKVILKKNDVVRLNYNLIKTSGKNRAKPSNRGQIARRLIFSTITAVTGCFGIFENYQVSKTMESADKIRSEYESKTSPFNGNEYFERYNSLIKTAHKHEMSRNVLYATSGGFGFLFIISIPF